MLIACVGAAVCNMLLGLLFLCDVPGTAQQTLFIVLYAANVLVQGFGTSAVVKINAAWYAPSERGMFAGVFNIMLTSGYFLALGAGSGIISSLGWAYVFAIPGAVLLVMAILISRVVKNSPADTHNSPDKQLVLISPVQKTAEDEKTTATDTEEEEIEEMRLPPKQQMKQLLRNHTFLGYLAALFFLCWARDGFLNWFLSFFDAVRDHPLTPSDTAIIGGAWTMGGFVGGILCGWLSDVVFHSDRVMPIVIFSLLQALMLGLISFVSATCSVAMLSGLVFLASVFLLGNYTLLSYTVPSDLPRDISAGAAGIMTAVGYFSTGLSGSMMGGLIDSAGYSTWALSLMTASVLAGVFTKLGSHFSAKKAKNHAVIAPLPPAGEERQPLAPSSSS
jgi:OPA family glycerol-3-phosphate transporter-like MFS transporter